MPVTDGDTTVSTPGRPSDCCWADNALLIGLGLVALARPYQSNGWQPRNVWPPYFFSSVFAFRPGPLSAAEAGGAPGTTLSFAAGMTPIPALGAVCASQNRARCRSIIRSYSPFSRSFSSELFT